METTEQKHRTELMRRGHDESEEFMLVSNGMAYNEDYVIDSKDNNKKVKIVGFGHIRHTHVVMFNVGQPISSKGRSAFRDYTLVEEPIAGAK